MNSRFLSMVLAAVLASFVASARRDWFELRNVINEEGLSDASYDFGGNFVLVIDDRADQGGSDLKLALRKVPLGKNIVYVGIRPTTGDKKKGFASDLAARYRLGKQFPMCAVFSGGKVIKRAHGFDACTYGLLDRR